jgi:hypothetical protein
MAKREQTAIGFDPDNIVWLRHRAATTGESMSEFLNKRVKEYREAYPDQDRVLVEQGILTTTAVSARASHDAIVEKIMAYFTENDHIMYNAKTQRKTTKQDLARIKEDLFFSKHKVDTTVEVIRPVLRDMMDTFDQKAYEKKRGIHKGAGK